MKQMIQLNLMWTILALLTPVVNGAEVPPGAGFYQDKCASCHGARLQGGNAQSLVDKIWQHGSGRDQIFRNIKYGITHVGMPSYQKALSDQEINQVIDYLLASESEAGVERPPLPTRLQTYDYDIEVSVWAERLAIPWGIDFINANHALVTERPGRLRQVINGKLLPEPVAGTPAVLHEGQGGLLDVAVDPDYRTNGWVYLSYSHVLSSSGGRPGAMTRLVRGKIKENTWVNEEVIFEAPHDSYLTTRHHYGCRIVFDDRYLYFGIGERGYSEHAQDLSRPNGKIHRIYKDGSVPSDNPFVGLINTLPTIYCYGNRNPQGLAVHPVTGDLWESEHGPFGGDELNLITGGANYGWPVITYGRNYDGSIITEETEKAGMAQPVLYWRPSIAVCGIDFYRGKLFDKWNNHLLVTALRYEEVRLLDIKDRRVLHDEVILKNAGRVRDVACGPDGAIYVVLNSPDVILRLTPVR